MNDDLATSFPLFFAGVPAATLAAASQVLSPRPFAAGEVLVWEGVTTSRLLLLRDGHARVTATVDGREVALGDVGPGAVLGDVCLLDGRPAAATVTTLSTGEALVLDAARLETLRTEDPALAAAIVSGVCRSLVARVREAHERLEELRAGKVRPGDYRLLDTLKHLFFGREA